MRAQSLLPLFLLLTSGCAYEVAPLEATTSAGVADLSVAYSVGGTLQGLAGTGLILQNNGTDDIAVGADGVFRFPAAIPNGGIYVVTVSQQPFSPKSSCTILNGSGNIRGGDVTNVQVSCSVTEASLGGHVDGLDAIGLVLASGDEQIALAKSGDFVFFEPTERGNQYAVSIVQQPEGETCTVNGGTGTITAENERGVAVECIPN